jgi:small GTP-binding protein
MQRILTAHQDRLLRQERQLLGNLSVILARLDAPEDDLAQLRRSLSQLDELFLLVVVGEFNAGKTAFLNALLGERVLKEGVTPTTSTIHLLSYGEVLVQKPVEHEVLSVHAPVDWLQEINLVDTPGTNAVIQRHQEITEQFVPRSDLVLFVTSADRPFSESERAFLERIREWGKKIIIIVNKFDLVTEEADREQILAFVRENATQLLGVEPQIFPVSARQALDAKLALAADADTSVPDNRIDTDALWQASQFGPLEAYILETLDASERLQLKLHNPLGVSAHFIDAYARIIANRKAILTGDFQTLDTIEEQLDAYEADMRRDFVYQESRVDNVLYAMAERGDKFFDETMRLTRILDLVNSEKIRGEFERQVVADTSREIEAQVSNLIDWMVDKDFRQWRAVMDYLNDRQIEHADRIVGQVGSDFEFSRQNLLDSVGREAQKVVDTYDREAESLKLAQDVQRSILQTAAVEASAIGLGAILVAVLQTSMLDFTGILGASAVAAMGLYVLPYRRSRVKAELRTKINELRGQLNTVLERQFERELQDGLQRIREAIAPYTRFVRVEREKIERLEADLGEAGVELAAVRAEVEQMDRQTK